MRLPVIPIAIIAVVVIVGCRAGKSAANTDQGSIKMVHTDSRDYSVHDPMQLTEEDYVEVAERLGVEVAAIKAVVDIEAGTQHKGFWTEGKPLINFDLSMYKKRAQARKIDLSKYQKSHAVIFTRPNTAKYGSQQAAQQARLDAAMTIDPLAAIEGTFWGMFQIGGFNWKACGAKSAEDFVEKMSHSERAQLDLFANFITSTGMVKYLKAKDWAGFARRYNGTNYAARGYHTRLANSYKKHSAAK